MIQIENLNFAYHKKGPLFKGLTLHLPPGNIYGLLGKNGAGKTTLLKIIAGLQFPQSGLVQVLGFEPRKRDPRLLCEVFFISEEFHLPKWTIDRFVRLYCPFYPRFSNDLLEGYLNEFGLDRSLRLLSLSYGQKKNFLLSFGLATDCKLLLLDEPTNGIDIPSKSLFRKLVANAIHEERNFIISTHQVRDMENLIDPILILDEGRMVFQAGYEQISRHLTISREQIPTAEGIVYSEPVLGGYTVVRENTTGAETSMNLEILFNAVVSNPTKIQQLFSQSAI